jgi:long-chain acyl-CoA synthetase
MISVPLYDTLGVEAMHYILEETNVSTLFLETKCISVILKVHREKGKSSLKNVIVMDSILLTQNKSFQADLEALKGEFGVKIYNFQDLIDIGQRDPREYAQVRPDDVHTICYTSGTTGAPKGALMMEKNFVSATTNRKHFQWLLAKGEEFRYLSYLPLAHIWERMNLALMLYCRGRYAVFGGDVSKIGEDLKILRPNFLPAPPRLFIRFYTTIQNTIMNLPKAKKDMIEMAINEKIVNMIENRSYKMEKWDNHPIFQKMRQILGGNMKCMWTGSAPMDPAIIDILQVIFACPLFDSYGQTEGCGTQFCQDFGDMESGTSGGVNSH